MKLKKGDYVLVSDSCVNEYKEMYNRGGRVQRIYKNNIIKVIWDSITLKTFSDDYIKEMIKNDYYLFDFNFNPEDLVLADPRDTLEDMYKAQEEVYNRKLKLLNKEIPIIEEYYDRFVISPFYEKLTYTQQDKSWDIINFFSKIMLNIHHSLPNEWHLIEFIDVYTDHFRSNVVASKMFFKSSKKVLLEFVKFLEYKNLADTKAIQNFLIYY